MPEKLHSFADRCQTLTVSNARTVLLTPEIYVNQNVYEQLLDLLLEGIRGARRFCFGSDSSLFLVISLSSVPLLSFSHKIENVSFLSFQNICVFQSQRSWLNS